MPWVKKETRPQEDGGPVPRPRMGHSMTPVRNEMIVMFGGQLEENDEIVDELWFLMTDNLSWINPNLSGVVRGKSPSKRHRHSAVYSLKLDRVIIFGGVGGGANLHILDPNWPEHVEWSSPSTSGPVPSTRFSFFMSMMESEENKLVIFGGRSAKDGSLNDYYELKMPKRLKTYREKANMIDMDAQVYMPSDERIMDECPWTDLFDNDKKTTFYYNTITGETRFVDPRGRWLQLRKKEVEQEVREQHKELKKKKRDQLKMKHDPENWEWLQPDFNEGIPPIDCSRAVVIMTKTTSSGKGPTAESNDLLRVFGAEKYTTFTFNTKTYVWNRYYDEDVHYPIENLTRYALCGFDEERFVIGGVAVRRVDEGIYTWNPIQDSWTKMYFGGVLPEGRFGHSMCAMGYVVYVAFGRDRARFHNDLWVFDATPLPWIKTTFGGAVPGARVNSGMALSAFERVYGVDKDDPDVYEQKPVVYLVGGASAGRPLEDIRRLDLTSMDWELIPVREDSEFPPAQLVSHTTCFYDDKVYTFAGGNGRVAHNHMHVFNTVQRRWEKVVALGAPPAPRLGHSATIMSDAMWVFGGYIKGIFFSDVHHFDFKDSTWFQDQPRGTRPPPRFAHSCSAPNGDTKLYIFGGISTGQRPLNDLWLLDSIEMVWERPACTGMSPSPRYAHTAEFVNDSMYIFGGAGGSKAGRITYNDIFVLNFAAKPPMWSRPRVTSWKPAPRSRMCSFVHNSKIYIFGGGSGTEHYDDLCCLVTNKKIQKEFQLEDMWQRRLNERAAASHGLKGKIDFDGDGDEESDEDGSDYTDGSSSSEGEGEGGDALDRLRPEKEEEDGELKMLKSVKGAMGAMGFGAKQSVAKAPTELHVTAEDDKKDFERILVRWGLGELVHTLDQEEVDRNIFVSLNYGMLRDLGITDHNIVARIVDLQNHLRKCPPLGYIPHYQRGQPFAKRLLKNRYILGEMTSWGDASVVLATDHGINGDSPPRTVAIKMHASLQAFRHEVHMYKHTPPEFVAPLVDAIEAVQGLGHCLVIEHGRTLSEYIHDTRLSSTERRKIIEHLLLMMHYFHSQGGVMCTLSPKILAEYDYNWRLINCEGLRRHKDAVPAVFDACYAAPELVKALKGREHEEVGVKTRSFDIEFKATRRMDTWALGIIMFELFTQTPMFSSEEDAVAAVGGRGVVVTSSMGAVDDDQARNLIKHCLQSKPKERYSLRNIRNHAYLQGGYDENQITKTFGNLQERLRHLQKDCVQLLSIHEERKMRLKQDLARKEAEEQAEKVRKREEQRKADEAERQHGKNLWMKVVEEEQRAKNESGTRKALSSMGKSMGNMFKSDDKGDSDVQWI